ncbi:MAG: hypothetical protein ACREJD_00420 [Phycisphaerales bacterium]
MITRFLNFGAGALALAVVVLSVAASATIDQPSPERVAAVREQLIEEERWLDFIHKMDTWTSMSKCLKWPKDIRDRWPNLYADVTILEGNLRVDVDKSDALAKAEARLPSLKAERLALIRDIYKDVLQVENLELSARLFQEGGGKENLKVEKSVR